MNNLKSNLQDDEVLIHVGFSENYSTKYAKEIQNFHFDGSRAQLSLHTLVVYLRNSILSFCTVSENIAHSSAALWTHLRPIFNILPCGIERGHFLSDGPVTVPWYLIQSPVMIFWKIVNNSENTYKFSGPPYLIKIVVNFLRNTTRFFGKWQK